MVSIQTYMATRNRHMEHKSTIDFSLENTCSVQVFFDNIKGALQRVAVALQTRL